MTAGLSVTPPEEIVDFLKERDGFFITVHYSPDGDALGSAAALGMALEALGKRYMLACRDPVPGQDAFLPGMERFLTFKQIATGNFDLTIYKNLVLVDCNEIKRTGIEKTGLAGIRFAATAVIDHHEIKSSFGDVRWVIPRIAAAGMMVYYLIRALGVEITKPIATNLYAALIVDTGNFRFPNTTSEVLRVAADLADAGAKPHVIYTEINESWSKGRFRLFLEVLNTLSINDGVALTHVTRKMFEETATTPDDTENFASFALTMRDIKIAAFMREIDEFNYKLSLRSVEEINVEQVAAEYSGGGHKNAAGCIAHGDMATVKAELIKRLSALL